MRERWTLWSRGVPLTILPSPFRSLSESLLEYIDGLQSAEPNSLVTVVIPEFVPTGWWASLLHGHAGFALALRLHFKQNVVVVNVPYHIRAYVSLREDAAPPATGSGLNGNSLANEAQRELERTR